MRKNFIVFFLIAFVGVGVIVVYLLRPELLTGDSPGGRDEVAVARVGSPAESQDMMAPEPTVPVKPDAKTRKLFVEGMKALKAMPEGGDTFNAEALLQQAAEAGHGAAALRLAHHYRRRGQDEAALRWYDRASELGIAGAAQHLAKVAVGMDDYGGYKPETLYEMLARDVEVTDDPQAWLRLGRFTARGIGTKRDFARALDQLRKAHERGEPRSLVDIGDIYADPDSGLTDFEKARAAYQEAIDAGEMAATLRLAKLLIDPKLDRPRDAERAVVLLRQARDQGSDVARYIQGRLHADPQSEMFDSAKAEELLGSDSRAADKYILGLMYSVEGPVRDIEKAENYLRLAYEGGIRRARLRLAELFVEIGRPAPEVRAILEPLAATGNQRAQHMISDLDQ